MIREVWNKRVSVGFGDAGFIGSSKLDVLTGPNGSGKTEVLVTIAEACRQPRNERGVPLSSATVLGLSDSSRVVAQTFSPFTRFPSPEVMAERIVEIYARGAVRAERYVSIGLHKSYRGVAGHISRHVLEEALFRWSQFPQATESLFSVLHELGFRPEINLTYRLNASLHDVVENGDQAAIEELLRTTNKYSRRLQNELSASSIEDLSALIFDSLNIARTYLLDTRPKGRYVLPVRIGTSKQEYFVLQACALLRRLKVFDFLKCELIRVNGNQSVDIADTSSGEQQLLCSIFGLASAVRNDAVVLIDEPELSLHPRRQIEFVKSISSIMKIVDGCHFIISTHSPLIVQAAQSLGASITQLKFGKARDLGEEVEGEISVEQALVEVFDTPVPHSTHVSNQIFKAIVQAETGGAAEQMAALTKLEGLQELYRNGEGGGNTVELLGDAIRIVGDMDGGDEEEVEE